MLDKDFQKKIKEIISDPVFQKPISHLKTDFTQKGNIILVTRIKPKYENRNSVS